MKIENHSIGVITQGFNDNDISIVKINEDAMEFVSQMFQNDIYSHKLKAAIRETVANAIDEHKKFNVQRPVEITFVKESGTNFLCIRDFAKGLDEENLREVFGGLFCSTKKLTNDSTGGFGIGAKSPICYNENFFVTSFFGERKTDFMFFRDKGKTGSSITKIAKYGDSPTHEPTGIEVRIPIKDNDKDYCIQITKLFVEELSSKINVVFNYDDKVISPQPENEWIFNGVKIVQKKESAISVDNDVYIRMGSINYPLPFDLNNIHFKSDTFIEVPIGTFSMPPSRETLSDTTENLKKWNIIANSIEKAYKEVTSNFVISFNDLTLKHIVSECFYLPNLLKDRKLPRCTRVNADSSGKKNIVVGIERSRAKELWFSRVNKFQLENPDVNVSYYYYNNFDTLYDFANINDVDEFILCKKDKRFKQSCGQSLQKEFSFKQKIGRYGSARFYTKTIQKFQQENPLADSIDLVSIAKNTSDIKQSIEFIKSNCIACSEKPINEENLWYVCRSAVNILEKFGYLNWHDDCVQKAVKELRDREREQEKMRSKIEQIKSYVILSSRTKRILHQMEGTLCLNKLQKGLDKVEKIEKVLTKIVNKSSLHKKVVDKNVYSGYSSFNRKEIKHILKSI